jgi:chromosome partitioning protein
VSTPSGTSSVASTGSARPSPPPKRGTALAELGYRVLVVDLDPQGNASTGLGIRHEARDVTVYDVIVAEAALDDAVVPTPLPNLFALPSTIDLAGAEIELVSQFSREARLKKALEPVKEGVYDFVLLDCPPSLGLLTINALTAAEELIVPIQCEYYALEGLGQLLRNVTLVQQNINPGLRVTGIVLTMFDPRTKLSEQVVDEVRRFFGELVYDVVIPRTVRLSEAPGFGQPITVYDPKSKGAETYRQLAREVAVRPAPTGPMPVYDDLPTVVVAPIEATVQVSPEPDPEPPPAPDVDAVPPADEPEPAREPEPEPQPEPEPEPQPEPEPRDVPDPGAVVADDAPGAPDLPPPAAGAAGARTPTHLEPPSSPPPGPASAVPAVDDEIWEEADRAPEPKVRAPTGVVEPGHLPERRVVVIDEQAEATLTTTPTPVPPQGHAEPPETLDRASEGIGATLADERPGGRKRWWQLFRRGG